MQPPAAAEGSGTMARGNIEHYLRRFDHKKITKKNHKKFGSYVGVLYLCQCKEQQRHIMNHHHTHPAPTTTTAAAITTLATITAPTVESAIHAYIDLLDVKGSSVALYKRTLRLFFEWVATTGRDVATLQRADILAYRADLFARGLSSLTIGSYLTSLRKFYQWAAGEGLVDRDITQNVKTPRRTQAFKKLHLSEAKSGELLHHYQSQSLRDFAIVNLLLRTGLRTVEVTRADVGDITYLGDRRVLRVWGKGRDTKDDFVVLTDKAYQPIKEYLATRHGVKSGDPLFASDSNRNGGERLTTRTISKICKDGLRAVGLDGREFTAHSLRHTAAVVVLQHGGNLADAQHLLRHASSDTTQIYVESIKQQQRLQHAAEDIIDDAL